MNIDILESLLRRVCRKLINSFWNNQMKKLLIVLATVVALAGCGDKSELELKLEHERAMAQIEVQKIKAANQVADTYYIENEYEYEVNEDGQRYSSSPSQASIDSSETYSHETPVQSVQQTTSGFSGGEMAVGMLAGAAAGYMASEMLNNGMKSYTDEKGNTHYTDKNGKPVSKQAYEDHKKKNPKTTKLREKVSVAKDKAKSIGSSVKQKAKDKYNKAKNSKPVRNAKAVAKKTQRKAKQKYNSYKSKSSSKRR